MQPALVGGHIPVPESWGDAMSFKVIVKASFICGFKRGASDKLTATCQFNASSPPPPQVPLPGSASPGTEGRCVSVVPDCTSELRGSSWEVSTQWQLPLRDPFWRWSR